MNWKVLSVVLIIVVVVETMLLLFVGISYYVGMEMLSEEQVCVSTCLESGADSYVFDPYTKSCECYEETRTEV